MQVLKVSDHGHINIYNEQGFSDEIKIILWYLKLKAFNYKASNNVQHIPKASVEFDQVGFYLQTLVHCIYYCGHSQLQLLDRSEPIIDRS
jgi:hypothetical protein